MSRISGQCWGSGMREFDWRDDYDDLTEVRNLRDFQQRMEALSEELRQTI